MILNKHLLNPDSPEAIYSYKYFHDGSDPKDAARWLIAHWYEHALSTCPCLHGDPPSNFRRACIDTLRDLCP